MTARAVARRISCGVGAGAQLVAQMRRIAVMMRDMVDLLQTFEAHGPTKKHLIRVWGEQLELEVTSVFDATVVFKPSIKFLDTADGLRLVRIEKGRYACPKLCEVFTSDDPNAP